MWMWMWMCVNVFIEGGEGEKPEGQGGQPSGCSEDKGEQNQRKDGEGR